MRLALALALCIALFTPASAQISFTGGYYQDFEDLGTDAQAALPDGWSASVHPTVVEPSAATYASSFTTTGQRGGILFARDRPGGIVNFGSGPEDTAPERALGVALRLGEVQTGLLYAHFRNDTDAPIDELLLVNYRELYRGGGMTTIFRDLFFSADGETWTRFGGSGANTTNGFLDGFPHPPGPVGGENPAELPLRVPVGGEWFFAYRYYATAQSGTTAPAMALDQFGIATSAETAGVVFATHGEVVFGPVFIGDEEPGGAEFNVIPRTAPLGTASVTGPHASDFVVTGIESYAFGGTRVVQFSFRPTAPGWRDAELRLFAADTVSRPVTLRGFGVVNPDDDDGGGGTVTDEADGATASELGVDVWPNPSAGPVRVRVQVPQDSPVRLSVFDPLGREVAVLVDRPLHAGIHDATFDTDRLPPGIYFARLVTPERTVTRPLTVTR